MLGTILRLHLLLYLYDTGCGQNSDEWHFTAPNIARGRPAYQYHRDFEHKNASLAVDGITTFTNNLQYCSHTSRGRYNAFPWWTVVFGDFFYLTGIRIYNTDTSYRERLKRFTIQGYTNDGYQIIFTSVHDEYMLQVINIPIDGTTSFNSITISLPGQYTYLTLCEVQVFASLNYCYQPKTLTNGHYDIKDYPVRLASQIRAVCTSGYTIKGNPQRTCQLGGSWSGPPPICVSVPCTRPPTEAHQISWTTNTFPVNTKLTVNCDNGYEPISAYITCSHGGHWDSDAPYCKIKRCRRPGDIQGGRYLNISNSFEYGTELQFVCDKGHISNIPEYKIICTSTGQWNANPICTKRACLVPDLLNGYYDTVTNNNQAGSPIHYGDILITKCFNSYRLKVTDLKRECMANGKLSGEIQLCVYKQNERIFPMCNFGFELEFGDEYLTCQANHTWKGHIATCKVPQCSAPNITDGIYVNETGVGRHVVYEQNERIFPMCNNGFELEFGDEYLTCQANHTWKGHIAICKVKQCNLNQLPLEINNILVNQSNQFIEINTNVLLQCKKGFEVTNTGFQQIRCNAKKQFEGEPLICQKVRASNTEGQVSVGEIGGIGGGCVLAMILITVLAVFLYRRRKPRLLSSDRTDGKNIELSDTKDGANIIHENEYSYATSGEIKPVSPSDHVYSTITNESVFNTSDDGDASHDYYSFSVVKIPKAAIRVSDLSKTIQAGDLSTLKLQFASFPKSMNVNFNAAVKTENRGKNKYKELYPYDRNRVILQPGNLKSETDYINASYINGFSLPKRYIASQAPLETTLSDFWRMIWQMDVSKIVMLTKLKEEQKDKCYQYWPAKDREHIMYGRVKVKLKKIERFSDFDIRHFEIAKDDSTNRKVIQFHFTSWPDRSVPKHASSLVHFRQKVMKTPTDTTGPVVVHCSAGVGRTGTFIALDILVEQGHRLEYVDVQGCVQSLREQRVMMVQTVEQYVFIHLTLIEALMLSPSVLPAATFLESYETALEINADTGKRQIDSEFEMLKSMSPSAEESQYVSAIEIQNRKKNRFPNILPVEESMPRLVDESGNAYYINAVFLPSYKTKDAFIITQTPLENTQEEFWRLVYDHKVHSIVMMNTVKELENDSEIYWPHGEETVTYNNMTVTLIQTERAEDHNVITLDIAVSNKKRKVKLFQYCHTVTDTFPGSPESVLVLMELVQYWQQQTGNNPILVHCMNGVGKSGLFCVISAVIERLKTEHDVAISQTIEAMRNSREQLISTVEQFKFCHDVVLTYLKQFETYSNFVEVHI